MPNNTPFTSISAMYAHLDTYSAAPISTIQEWEMANDLGDIHCLSLMQGGALPASSTNQRVVGKIFPEIATNIQYELFHTSGEVIVSFHDTLGTTLHIDTLSNAASSAFTSPIKGWITIKIRNADVINPEQKCFVKLSYSAPKQVVTMDYPSELKRSIWTGNGNDQDVLNCMNWEEGTIPNQNIDVFIPAYSSPAPDFTGTTQAKSITVEKGAKVYINGILQVVENLIIEGSL